MKSCFALFIPINRTIKSWSTLQSSWVCERMKSHHNAQIQVIIHVIISRFTRNQQNSQFLGAIVSTLCCHQRQPSRQSQGIHGPKPLKQPVHDGKHCVWKSQKKFSFNIASEASYVYILSGPKLIKNAKNSPFWRVFENLKLAVK